MHEMLNDPAHRAFASAVVRWPERPRGGPGRPPLLTVHAAPSRGLAG
ncbi:hypothetical protein [Streptomyces hoynatensis]|nr:hypothetical protein [Streptomyces hoynatensis]